MRKIFGLLVVRRRAFIHDVEVYLLNGACKECGAYRCRYCMCLIVNTIDHAPQCRLARR